MRETPEFVRQTSVFAKIGVLAVFTIAMMLLGLGVGPLATEAGPASESPASARSFQDATPIGDEATPAADSICEPLAPGVGSEAWIRTELYFGTTMPDGSRIADEDWQAFLDEEITPRFPDGLTVLEGNGQFLNSSGVIIAEDSIVLIIFYPPDAVEESSASIEEIRDAYEIQFEQESVLRVDSAPVCVSF